MNDVMQAFEAKTIGLSDLVALGAASVASTTGHPLASAVAELRASLAAPAHLACFVVAPDCTSAAAGVRHAA